MCWMCHLQPGAMRVSERPSQIETEATADGNRVITRRSRAVPSASLLPSALVAIESGVRRLFSRVRTLWPFDAE